MRRPVVAAEWIETDLTAGPELATSLADSGYEKNKGASVDTRTNKATSIDRRITARHRSRTTVYVALPGTKPWRCKSINISARGVYLETESLYLPRGLIVQLVFTVRNGDVVHLYRRTAVVTHSSDQGAGLKMYTPSSVAACR